MFYSDDKIIEYPNKSILEDVLSRNGVASENSFTPFEGCAYILREQLGDRITEVTTAEIIAVSKEFDIHKARATEEENRDCYAIEVDDYYMRLEDIKQSYIDNYVRNIIIGYKINNNGMRKRNNEFKVQQKWYDEEAESYVVESDILVKEHIATTEEILDARAKLPYLLKQLHNGSIYYRGSLLSFIIAAEKCYRRHIGDYNYIPKPGELASCGVYRVDNEGNTTTKFHAKDNTANPYRSLVAWIQGRDNEPQGQMYYRAYQDLLKVLDILDIDIIKEDATEYTNEYIKKMVCTYLASNEEYIESYGFVDRRILDKLSPNELFSIASKMSGDSAEPKRLTLNMLAECIAINTEALKYRNPVRWREQPEKVNKFLAFFCKRNNMPIKTVSDYSVCKGLLVKEDGSYVTMPVGKIKDTGNLKQYAVITISGYLICVEEVVSHIEVLGVEEAIQRMGGLSNDKEWEMLSI